MYRGIFKLNSGEATGNENEIIKYDYVVVWT